MLALLLYDSNLSPCGSFVSDIKNEIGTNTPE